MIKMEDSKNFFCFFLCFMKKLSQLIYKTLLHIPLVIGPVIVFQNTTVYVRHKI